MMAKWFATPVQGRVRAAAMGASAFGGSNLDVKTAPQDERPVIVRERRAMQVGRVSGLKTPPLRVKPRGARLCQLSVLASTCSRACTHT